MTYDEFVRQLESAVSKNDRWAITQILALSSKDKLRKEACRHADNLIILDKDKEYVRADLARLQLMDALKRLRQNAVQFTAVAA